MKLSLTLLLPVLTAFAQAAQEATAPEDSHVVKLTSENFEEFLQENPLVLAEFYAPWCGHCKNLAPAYVEAAEILSQEEYNIPIAQVNCDDETSLCQGLGIRGYPTLKVFRGSPESAVDYEGARSADAIVSHMIKQSQPAVIVADKAEVEKALANLRDATLVAVGSKHNETIYELANSVRDKVTVYQTEKAFGKDGQILLYLEKDGKPIAYEGEDFTAEALAEWIKIESVPYFGEIDATTFQGYMDANIPLAYFFYNDKEERAAYEKLFAGLGKEHRGKINFAGLDASLYGKHASNLNMEEVFPLFVIHDLEKNQKFGFEVQGEPLKQKALAKFVKDFAAGKLEPIVKSEDIPEVQEEAVFKIVGKNHDEIINDSTKDVFVKYTAPWCGHCKRLAPVFEELAEEFADDENTIIANLDATLNDVNVKIEGYPTIIYYPAKGEPITYTGPRDLESFAQFITEHGTFPKTRAEKVEEVEEEVEEDEEVDHDEL